MGAVGEGVRANTCLVGSFQHTTGRIKIKTSMFLSFQKRKITGLSKKDSQSVFVFSR